MPQPVQIVPTMRHPHSMVVINNNTFFDDSVAESTFYGASSIFVINSPKGEDRTIVPMTKASNFLEEFGVGNFTQNGQPYFNAYNFLSKNNNVLAYIMRVTADDASYANAVIVAKVKKTAAVDEATPAKFEVFFSVVNLPGVLSVDDLTSKARALREDTPDGEGFTTYPLLAFHSTGRGEYGNNLRFRLIKDTNLDLENSFLNYRLDVYELEEYLKIKNAVKGSLYEDAIEGYNTLFIGDTLNDIERSKAKLITFQENFEDLYEEYIEHVNPDIVVPYEQFDFFYGIQKADTDPIEGYEIISNREDVVNLESAEGVALVGGSDGNFGRARTDAEKVIREGAISEAYSKAFQGEYDRRILSKRQVPQNLFFDANYPKEVKFDIINWLVSRHDGYGHLDAGIVNTLTDAIGFGEEMYNLGHITHGKHFQSHEVRDPFTNKRIRVTYPYFLAGALPTHFMNGMHLPYAASDAQLSGHVKRSVKPDLDADDSISKEQLYILRLNYLETVAENVYYRATQSTSDIGKTRNDWSDLNEENNVYVLLDYKRKLENMVADLSYDFSEAEDRDQFSEAARRLFSADIGTKVRELNVRFDMNPWEEERSILHCYLDVVFRTISKRSIIEIDVNPRV